MFYEQHMAQLTKKVILVGQLLVGKTSIFNKYIYNKFSEQYTSIIGVHIDKKTLEIEEHQLNLILWDSNQENTPQSYFLGTGGVIYVIDLSNASLFNTIKEDISFIKNRLPNIPILIVGNKKDLLSESALSDVIDHLPITPDLLTSAKTGENIDLIFETIGKMMIAYSN